MIQNGRIYSILYSNLENVIRSINPNYTIWYDKGYAVDDILVAQIL